MADYFPPLDKCLAGPQRLISWKTAWRALCDPNIVREETTTTLQRFLNTEESRRILRNALTPFTAPSQTSKRDFETKTAPIHVSDAADGEYSLEEIKQDTLWLSQEVQVEELAALRLAILEWQQRPAHTLLLSTTSPQGAANASSNFKGSLLARSSANGTASIAVPSRPELDFASQETRRERLLCFYLEEREYIAKIAADLVSRSVVRSSLRDIPSSESWTQQLPPGSWVDELATDVRESYHAIGNDSGIHTFCAACIGHLDEQMSETTTESIPHVFTASQSRTELYITAKLRRLVDLLRLLLGSIYGLQGITHPTLVRAWFDLMDKTAFFQDPQSFTLVRAPSTMDSLVSMTSLAIFQLPQTLANLQDCLLTIRRGDVEYPSLSSDADVEYVLNEASTTQITLVLCQAARQNITVAGPAVYAWGIITTMLKTLATEARDARDHSRMNDESSDNEGTARLSSHMSRQKSSIWEQRWESIQETPGMDEADPDIFFARAAADQMMVYLFCVDLATTTAIDWDSDPGASTAFVSRDLLLALIRHSMSMVSYNSDVLEAIYAILAPQLPGQTARPTSQALINKFLVDEALAGPHIMNQCVGRYPYELSPFLQLFTILANAESANSDGSAEIIQRLQNMQSFTVMVPLHFRSYTLENEDEGGNEMVLTDPLPLFISTKASARAASSARAITNGETQDGDNVTSIPAGTSGQVAGEDRTKVLQLNFPHSALEYLGLLLSTILPSPALRPAPPSAEVDRETATEIVALINALLRSSSKQIDGQEQASLLLGTFSHSLRNGQDITATIADILEMELQDHLDQKAKHGSIGLLAACVEFLDIITGFFPERTWAILGRSSLLGLNGGASSLAASVTGSELPSGKFRFLSVCVKLYSNLLDDAITGLIKRKAKPSRNGHRFEGPEQSLDSLPERLMSTVVTAYQRVMLDAFQNFAAWRFTIPDEKHKMSTQIAATFHKLLRVTFGVEAPAEPSLDPDGSHIVADRDRFSVALIPAAQLLLEAFAPEADASGLLATLTNLFGEGIKAADDVLQTHLRTSVVQQTRELCGFTASLVRTLKMLDPSRATALGNELMKNMPVFAMLLAADDANKGPLSDLLGEIIQAVAMGSADPPALLGPLSPDAAKAFLTVISHLDQPLCDVDVEVKVWEFLSAVLGGRQQWFAVYLLTGTLPRTRLREANVTTKAKSLLAYVLDELSQPADLPPDRAKAMLHFVAKAQDVWIWATNEVRSHNDFLNAALSWFDSLLSASSAGPIAEEVVQANEAKMAALLCDILAVNIHAGLEVGDKSVVQKLKEHMGFLQMHAVKIDTYRRSLHRNLADNMRRKYPYCELADFKRTKASPAPYGDSFLYDLELADTVLKYDTAWIGATVNGRKRGQGFHQELVRANNNLSLVDAQTSLLESWKALAITLCECAEQETPIRTALAVTAQACLQENMTADLEIPGTADALQSRLDLAFMLISKLVSVKANEPAMKQLLRQTWSLVRSSPVDYDIASAPEDLRYYRMLLQVLYLAIQPLAYMKLESPSVAAALPGKAPPSERGPPALPPDTGALLVEIVQHAITTGFRALCGNLHTDLELALPADFALLTALLQAVLSVKGVASVHALIADAIAMSGTVRSVLSLYSWADQLAAVMADDPIYGEVAITFLLSVSTIPLVAEQIALDGVLVQISSANISNYYRKPDGKSPFDEPVRMFTIWSEGLLPLCLNLLDAVGPPMAGEVAVFLNTFPQQLHRAGSSLRQWASSEPHTRRPHIGDVTLSLIAEAHSLLLIGMILESDAVNGAADGVNATNIPPLDIDMPMLKGLVAALPRSRRSLIDRIVPTNEREAQWAQTAVTGASQNLLVEKVIREMCQAAALLGEPAS